VTSETDAEMRRPPRPVDWRGVRRVHLSGICGSAMGGLAQMLASRGFEVRGSDASPYPPMSDMLAARGVGIMIGYEADNLDWGPDVVVVGNVMRPTYPEAVAVRARGVPHCSLPQALAALFLADALPVVVAGTHGKTTTSSWTAWLLEAAGATPSFFIGGVTGNWGSSWHLGAEGAARSGPRPFVVEGDEYDTAYFDRSPKLFHYGARIASINNIEFDHADIYRDVEAIEAVFTRFAATLPSDGRLVVPAHDLRARAAASASGAPVWLAGIEAGDVVARDVRATPEGTRLVLELPGAAPEAVALPVPGVHNVYNALVSAGLAYAAGADAPAIARGLGTVALPRRRLTLIGERLGVPVIDDFAHHPTAIAATLAAVRQRYPERRLVALFEAQSNTARRRVFQDGFEEALATADRVWFCRALEKASDPLPPEQRLDLAGLAAGLEARGVRAAIEPAIDDLATRVAAETRPGQDVILVMSGRDFGGIHRLILDRLAARDGAAGS